MLKKADSVAAKFFDPWDVSLIADVDPATLWRISEKGDKWTAFYTELAASPDQGGEYRQGIALSRLAEVCLNVGKQLETNKAFKQCIVPKVFEKAATEFKVLRPHFLCMNAGKGSQNTKEDKQETIGGLKRKLESPSDGATLPTKEQVTESATRIYKWLQAGTDSNFRMLMQITSLGGSTFGFVAADKVTRAWIEVNNITVDEFVAKSWARIGQAKAPAQPAAKKLEIATGGLFD